jgi:hypothetical protein
MKHSWSLVAVIALVTLAFPPTSRAQSTVPRFELSAYPVDAPSWVECGYLIVPEDRAGYAAGGRTLRLAIAILKSRGDDPSPDPLFARRKPSSQSNRNSINARTLAFIAATLR